MLSLAEKSLEKSIEDKIFTAPESLRLYLLVLNRLKKYEATIKVLLDDEGFVLRFLFAVVAALYLFVFNYNNFENEHATLHFAQFRCSWEVWRCSVDQDC